MSADPQQSDIPIREDRAQVTRHQSQGNNANGFARLVPIVGAGHNHTQEQQDSRKAMFSPIRTALSKQAEDDLVQGQDTGRSNHDKPAKHGLPL